MPAGVSIADVLSIVAPTFILAVVGIMWVKLGNVYETKFVTKLVVYIGTPSLVFSTLAATSISPDAFFNMALASAMVHATLAVTGLILLRVLRLDMRAYLGSFFIANGGNLGLPICLFAFGQEGLALGISYFVIQVVLTFTVGIWLPSGKASPAELFKLPMIYAAALGIGVAVYGLEMPKVVLNTVDLTGGMMIPLMLITLGVSIASLNPTGLGRSLMLSVVRLCVGVGAAFLIADLLGMTGPARGILILQASMPAAVFNYLFAEMYDRNAPTVAGIVMVSTLLTVAVLPFIVAYVLATSAG